MIRKLLLILLFSVFSSTLYAEQGGDLRSPLFAVIPPDLPPYYFKDAKTNQPAGLAVDLTNALAQRAGLQVRYRFAAAWDEVDRLVLSGEADLVPMRVMNQDTEQLLLFTDAIDRAPISYLVRSTDSVTKGPAPGLRVGVMSKSTAYTMLKERQDITLTQYDSLQHLLMDLIIGKIDLVLTFRDTIMRLAEEAGLEQKIRAIEPPLLESKRGIGLHPDNRLLQQQLNTVIKEYYQSPEYVEIFQRWLGAPQSWWTTRQAAITIGSSTGLLVFLVVFWRYYSVRTLNSRLKEEVETRRKTEDELRIQATQLEEEIAERQKTQEELMIAKDLAEAANKAKTQFLANMSHELRTPLNGIIGMAQLVALTGVTEEQQEYINTLQVSAENLTSLIGDILDITKIEVDQLQIQQAEYSLRQCIEKAIMMQQAHISAKGLSIESTISAAVPALLIGDHLRVLQVLSNLLSNAIKFTDTGGIRFEVAVKEQHASTILLDVAVTDTGIGIEPSKLDHIFNMFTQADESNTRRHGGAGLGLAISRKLAELMGGSITVESKVGKGSTFHLLLPCTVSSRPCTTNADAVAPTAPTLTSNKKRTVLIAEDNPANYSYAIKLMEILGYQTTLAVDGTQALLEWGKGTFDLILMDIQMPGLNGDEVVKTIRQREGTASHVPIIAVTAHALAGDQERFLGAGFDGYVAKPFFIETLAAEIKRVYA